MLSHANILSNEIISWPNERFFFQAAKAHSNLFTQYANLGPYKSVGQTGKAASADQIGRDCLPIGDGLITAADTELRTRVRERQTTKEKVVDEAGALLIAHKYMLLSGKLAWPRLFSWCRVVWPGNLDLLYFTVEIGRWLIECYEFIFFFCNYGDHPSRECRT